MIVAKLGAPDDMALVDDAARAVATGYATTIAQLASGSRIAAVTTGAAPHLDAELAKSQKRGDMHYALDELAPVADGVRRLAIGDLEPVAMGGVIEDRVLDVQEEQSAWIDEAIAAWARGRTEVGATRLRARRVGSGVASYAAYRFQVVLEGATEASDDDIVLELKETRDGVAIANVWQPEAAEWDTPAERAVTTQLRLQARADGDARLGFAQVGALSLKLRDREAYQRGIDAEGLSELAATDRAQLVSLAEIYGGMLARAHGQALTADRERGFVVIAPLLVGRTDAFADESSHSPMQLA